MVVYSPIMLTRLTLGRGASCRGGGSRKSVKFEPVAGTAVFQGIASADHVAVRLSGRDTAGIEGVAAIA